MFKPNISLFLFGKKVIISVIFLISSFLYSSDSYSKSVSFYRSILIGGWAIDCSLNPKSYMGAGALSSIGYSVYRIRDKFLYEDQYYDPPVGGIDHPIKFLKTGVNYIKIQQGRHVYEYIFSEDYSSYRIYSELDVSRNTFNISVGRYVYDNAETPYVHRCRNLDIQDDASKG